MALCSAFTRLSSLELHCVTALPPCLGDLTGLQRLAVVSICLNCMQLGPNIYRLPACADPTRLQQAAHCLVAKECVALCLTSGSCLALASLVQWEDFDAAFFDDMARIAAMEASLDAALRHLTGLTSLYLRNPLRVGHFAAGLCSLTRLQRLYFFHDDHDGPLPGGPWCSSLQVLGAEIECLDISMPMLAACTALQHVFVMMTAEDYGYEPGPFWEWAQQHAPLQLLQLHHTFLPDGSPHPELEEAAVPLQRAWPELAVEWVGSRRRSISDVRRHCISYGHHRINLFEAGFLWSDGAWAGIHGPLPT